MKKLIYAVLAIAACAAAALYFVLKPLSETPHANLIPDDATAVVIADAKEVVKDAGIKFDFAQLFKNKDKESAGVDFLHPVYAFLTKEGNVGLAAVLSDSKELEAQLEDVRQAEGLTWGMAEGMLACHDGSRMLMVGPNVSWEDKTVQQQMVQLMNKKSSESYLFQDLNKKDAPLKAKIDLSVAETLLDNTDMASIKDEVAEKYMGFAGLDSIPQLDALCLDLIFTCSERSLALSTSLSSPNEQTAAFLNTYKEMLRPINHQLDAHIPASPELAMWMCMNMNGAELLNILKQNKEIASELKAAESMLDVSSILSAFNGDMMLFYNGGMEAALLAQVDNTSFLTPQIKELLGYVQISTGSYEDNTLYVTNSKPLQSGMQNGGYEVPKEDGYTQDCVFFLTVSAAKALEALCAYANISEDALEKAEPAAAEMFQFMKNDVDRINLRATKDAEVELKVFLNSAINDYVSKWTE